MRIHNGDADSTRVVQELSQMEGYWGGNKEVKAVVVVHGLLATPGQDVVWLLM